MRKHFSKHHKHILFGTNGPDGLVGTPDDDTIHGLAGADTLDGVAGDDVLSGDAGDDVVFGGEADDTVLGGAGNDHLLGDSNLGPTPSFGGSLETQNLILAGSGNDLISAGYGADTVHGGSGGDTISGYGVAPVGHSAAEVAKRLDRGDLLLGGSGGDVIDGGGGTDTILGGPGGDSLVGSYDADFLVGGPGEDRFVFRLLGAGPPTTPDTGLGEGSRDVVLDFKQGQDKLDLSGYRNPAGGSSAPVFLGTGDFIATFELQVRYEKLEDGRTLVQFDTTLGRPSIVEPPVPAEPMGEIVLAGRFDLTASDFIL
jgi:Ca2+-binding RTX toxin-like protein